MYTIPVTSRSVGAAVSSTTVAAHTAMTDKTDYVFCSSTNCWIRQGTSKLITCATKANSVDTDYITITVEGVALVYELDTSGNGAASGHVAVDISGATTAASIAAILRTAILAHQTTLTVTDPTNGTLIVDLPESRNLTITENVAHASFTVGTGIMQATAGTGSMFVPALLPIILDGTQGGQLGVIRNTADGSSSTTPVELF